MRSLLANLAILVVVLLLLGSSCETSINHAIDDKNPAYRMMFYNVENLFDTIDHPDYSDEEFTPNTDKNWNTQKYWTKLNGISKVAREIGKGEWPPLIGMCEIENRSVLEALVLGTDMSEGDYEIIHKESPDFRGIDVALLYRPELFNLMSYNSWPVWFPFDQNYSTREVLYVKGSFPGNQVVHVLVNHWPSRSGGEIETRAKRIFVAELVRTKVDSILQQDQNARIIITGDFNDDPDDLSIVSGLNALDSYDKISEADLYALSKVLFKSSDMGSYKYKGTWNMLDQFIISGTLLDTLASVYCRTSDVHVLDRPFLLEKDETYMGKKPFRTYLGDYYHGGYSDHLPVYLDIHYRNQ